MPSGPTVTASGRQVRSRATGLYGETLHSGQVSDRASPATGDYVRSDVSEEPQPHTHGRSTRAANRGLTNGQSSRHTALSDEEDDATSWDGGDEDEDEPEQMELDVDDDEQAEESSDEDEDPQTLVVTLRYGKGSFSRPGDPVQQSVPVQATIPTNGVVPGTAHLLSGTSAPRQPEQQRSATNEPPVQPAPLHVAQAPPQQQSQAFNPNGIHAQAQPLTSAVAHPAAQYPQLASSVSNHNTPPAHYPSLDHKAPLLPQQYQNNQSPPLLPQQPGVVAQSQPAQQSFNPALPPPTPASNWQ